MAQAFCSEVAVKAAEECVQLHGGIGMTWEYPAHLYLKRAKADQIAFGTAGAHRQRLGELVDLNRATEIGLRSIHETRHPWVDSLPVTSRNQRE